MCVDEQYPQACGWLWSYPHYFHPWRPRPQLGDGHCQVAASYCTVAAMTTRKGINSEPELRRNGTVTIPTESKEARGDTHGENPGSSATRPIRERIRTLTHCERFAASRGSPVLRFRSRTLEQWQTDLKELGGVTQPPSVMCADREMVGSRVVTSTYELRRAGVETSQIESACRSGHIVHLARGWYVSRRLFDGEMMHAVAAILPDDAVFAGETAALMYGVSVRDSHEADDAFRICVLRPAGTRAVRRPGVACRVMEVDESEIVSMEGMRVTSALRTVCDVAMGATIDLATAWIEGFLRQGLVTVDELVEAAQARAGRRGVRILRAAINNADIRSESVQETALRLRLREAGLPRPILQIPVRVSATQQGRIAKSSSMSEARDSVTDSEESLVCPQNSTNLCGGHASGKGSFRIDLGWCLPAQDGGRSKRQICSLGRSWADSTGVRSEGAHHVPGGASGEISSGLKNAAVKIGVEYFGEEFHPETGPQAEHDRWRIQVLEEAGWTILVVRRKDLRGETPYLERRIAQLLGHSASIPMRRSWKKALFDRRRNAWTRDESVSHSWQVAAVC